MNPRFSIIIPIYNLENYIHQCLDSVLIQNLQSWEAIVVNDGSVDNSLKIIAEYAMNDSRFKIIDKPNGGLSAARNDALNMCIGDYVIFLDGDDWLNNKALEVLNCLIGSSEMDLLVHQMNYYYSDSNCKVLGTNVEEGNYTGTDFLHSVLINKQYNFYVAQAKAYRREFLKKNKLRFIQGILHEDGPFFYEVCHKAEKVIFSKKALYYYRQNREGQITATRTFKNYEGVMRGVENNLILYGSDKIVNGAMLNLCTFLAGKYKTMEDENKAFSKLRSFNTKRLLLYFLLHSKTDFKVWFRGILLTIDPLLLKIVYRIWF